MSRRTSTIAASAWSFAANWGQQLAATALFFYLAAQLAPSDFGVVAMAAAIVDLLTIAARFGQVEALLQSKDQDNVDVHTSHWFLVGLGVVLMAVIIGLGAFAGDLYGDDRIPIILFLLAPIPLIQNVTLANEYLLRRDLAFRGIAFRNVSATLISGIVSVVMAHMGYGYYALVAQKLLFTLVNSLALAAYRPWMPRMRFSLARLKPLARAGFDVSLANLIGMANSRVIDLFIGHYFGFVVLGNLRIAWRLFDLLLQFTLQPVANVAVSSLTQPDLPAERMRKVFGDYVGALAVIAYPVFAGVILVSSDVVTLLFGQNWEQAGGMLRWLCLSFVALPLNYMFPSAMLATGNTGFLRRQSLFQLLFTVVTVFFSSQFSIEVVLLVHVARVYLFVLLNAIAIRRSLGFTFRNVFARCIGPLTASLLMLAAVFALRSFDLTHDIYVTLLLEVAVGILIYVLVTAIGELSGIYPANVKSVATLALKKLRKGPYAR